MNQKQNSNEIHDLEPPLQAAVQSILADPVPEDAAERVKTRAKQLATATKRDPGVLEATTSHSNASNVGQRVDSLGHVDPARSGTGQVRSARRLRLLIPAVGTAAATLVITFVLLTGGATFAWDDVLATARERLWIHGVVTASDGKSEQKQEFWLSPKRRVAAIQFGSQLLFDDFQLDVTTRYDKEEGVVYRTPRVHLRSEPFQPIDETFFERLLMDEKRGAGAFPDEDVVDSRRQEITEDDSKWIEFTIHLKRKYEPLTTRELKFRVAADTGLLHSSTVRYGNGLTVVTRFDYPATGPRNIHDLGVPKTAKLVDRVPRGDLARIAASWKADRQRFDDYDAIVVTSTEGRNTSVESLMNLHVRRVRRKGNRLRIDLVLVVPDTLVLPATKQEVSGWWKNNRDRFVTVPLQVCDGETMYFYRMVDHRLPKNGLPDTRVRLQQWRAINLPADDPRPEWAHLMPEYCARPHLWLSDPKREAIVDTDPNDGPNGTVRVVVKATGDGRATGERIRCWIDPSRGNVPLRLVTTVFNHERRNEVAYLDTQDFEELTQSPSGIWYPRRIRRQTSNSDIVQITEFYMSFDVKLSDDIFEPVETVDGP